MSEAILDETPDSPEPAPEPAKENKVAKAIGAFGSALTPEQRAAKAREALSLKESVPGAIARVVYAARAFCLCGERLASPDGNGNWQCSRLLLNNAPTKACQRLPANAKIYAEGSEELMEIVRVRKEGLGIN